MKKWFHIFRPGFLYFAWKRGFKLLSLMIRIAARSFAFNLDTTGSASMALHAFPPTERHRLLTFVDFSVLSASNASFNLTALLFFRRHRPDFKGKSIKNCFFASFLKYANIATRKYLFVAINCRRLASEGAVSR